MNKIFRVIWSRTLNVFVVVSELATGRCKSSNSTQVSVADKLSLLSFTLKPLAALFSAKTITSMASAAVFGSVLFASQSVYAAQIIHSGSSIYNDGRTPPGVANNYDKSIILGSAKNNVRTNSVVLGFDAAATAEEATAIGNNTKATSNQAVAVGWSATSRGSQATAIGNNVYAGGHGSIAIGGDDVGNKAAVVTNGGDVVGRYNVANNTVEYFLTQANIEDVTTKITNGEVLSSDKDVFVDPKNNKYYRVTRNTQGKINFDAAKNSDRENTYKYSKLLPTKVLETYRKHKKQGDTFEGVNVGALNEKLAKGNSFSNTWAEGKGSIAMGARSVAYGDSAVAIGTLSFALGNNSSVFGSGSFAFGDSSQAIGSDTYVYAPNSVGLGSGVQVIKDGGMAFGYRARSGGTGSITIGTDVYADVQMDYDGKITHYHSGGGTRATRIHRANDDRIESRGNDEPRGILTHDGNGSRKVAGTNTRLNSGSYFSYLNNAEYRYINRLETAIKDDQALKPVTELDANSGIISVVSNKTENSIVIGSRSASSGSNNILMGRGVFARDDNSIAIGSYSYTLNKNAIAIGLATRALAVNSISLGVGSVVEAGAKNATVVGSGSYSQGENSSLFGAQSSIWGPNSMVLGNNSSSAGPSNIILGNSSKIDRINASVDSSVENSIVIGHGAEILVRNNENKANMLAIGNKSKAYFANSVAIGYESETDYTIEDLRSPAWTAKGSISLPNPERVGILSVGRIGGERRISNVAAGYRDTDAANVSQLKRIDERIDNLSFGGESNSVRYFSVENKLDTTVNNLNTLAEYERDYKSYLRLQEQALIVAAREKRGDGIDATFKKDLTDKLNALKTKLGGRVSADGKELSGLNVSAAKYGTTGANYKYEEAIADIAAAKKRDEAKSALTDDEKRQLEEANFTNLGAKGKNSIAVGYTASANTDAETGIAMGYKAQVTKKDAVAVGRQSQGSGQNAVAIGTQAQSSATSAVAIGRSARAEGAQSVAIGGGNTGDGTDANGAAHAKSDKSIAIGHVAVADGTESVSVGYMSSSANGSATSLGARSKAMNNRSTALGNHAEAMADKAFAAGYHSNASGISSIAIGAGGGADNNRTTASAMNAIAIGTSSKATHENSVALGAGSETGATTARSQSAVLTNSDGGNLKFSWTGGTAATSSISVGKAGAERQIHHVAAGDVSANSTDAINGSQLYALANTKMLFAGNTGNDIGRLVGEKLTIKGKADSGLTVTPSGNNTLEIGIDTAKAGNVIAGTGITLGGNANNRLLGTGNLTVGLSDEYKNKINAIKSYEVTNDGNLISVTNNGSTASTQKWKIGFNVEALKTQLGQLGAITTLTAGNTNHKIGEKNTTLTITGANGIEAGLTTATDQSGNGTLTIKLDSTTKGKIDKIDGLATKVNTVETKVNTIENNINTIETKLGSGKITFADGRNTQDVALGKQFKIEGNDDITATIAADGTAGAKVSLALQKATDIATGGTKVVTADAVKSYVDGATGDKAKSDLSNVDTTALTNKITKGNLNSGSMVEVTGGSSKLIGGDASIDLNAATKAKIGKIGGGTITANDDKTVTGSTVFEYLNNTFSSKLSLTSDGNTEAGSVDLKTQKLKVTGQNGVNVAIENQGISVGLDTATKNKIDKIDDIESNVDGLTTKFNNTAFKYKSTNPNVGTTGTSSSADQSYSLNSENAFVFEGDKNIITTATAGKVSFALQNSLTGINSITGQNGTASITFNQNDLTINSKQIKGVNKGTDDKDVATIAQLKDLANKLAGGTGTTSVGGDGSVTTPTFSLPNAGTGTGGTTTHNNIGSALTALDTKLGNIINAATNQTITYYKDTNDKKTVKLTDGLHFQAGNNLNLTVAENGSVLYGLSPTLTDITSISGGNNTLTFMQNGGGFDFGGKKLTGVSKGTVSTDAVNYDQLNALAQALGATVENDGSVTKPTINISVGKDGTPGANGAAGSAGTGTDNTVTTIGDAIEALDNALTKTTLSFAGDNSSTGSVKLRDQTLTIAGTENVITTTANGQKLTIDLHQNIKDAIAKANSSGDKDLGNLSDKGKEVITGLVTATNDTANGKGGSFVEVTETVDQTTKVKTIKVGIDETKLEQNIDISYKSTTSTGADKDTGTKSTKLSSGFNFQDTTNISAEVGDTGLVKFSLNKDLTGIDSIAKADAKSKISLGDGSVTLSGNNNSAITLTGVAAGKGANDAINKQQLSDALAKLGGNAGVDNNGNITGPTYTLDKANSLNSTNGTAGTNGAVGTVGAALLALDGAIGKLDEKLGNTKLKYKAATENDAKEVALSTGLHFQSGNSNLTVATEDGGIVKYTLSNALTGITSIAGNGNTLTFAENNGGFNFNNAKLTGVNKGTSETDAVNYAQLKALADAMGATVGNDGSVTKPTINISVGKDGTPGANGTGGADGAGGTAGTGADNKVTTINDAITALDKALANSTLSFTGDTEATVGKVKLREQKLKIAGTTGEITTSTTADGQTLTIALSQEIKDAIGKANASGDKDLGNLSDTGKGVITGLVKATKDNTAGKGGSFVEVTETVDPKSKAKTIKVGIDETNLEQSIDISYKATTKDNGEKTAGKKSTKLSSGFNFQDTTNISAEVGETGLVKFSLNKNLTGVESIAREDGKSKIALGEGSVTLSGDNNSAITLTGVAAGKGDNDAINKKQLSDALAKLGGGATVGADGTITAPTYTLDKVNAVNGTNGADANKNTVEGALSALNTAIGKLSENLTGAEIKYKAGDETAKAVALSTGLTFTPAPTVENTDATNNLTISTADAGVVKFSLNKDLTGIDSIKKGDGKGALSLGDNTASLESAAGKSKVDLTAGKAELTLGENKSSVKLEEGKATVESAKDASAVKLENEKATLTAGKDKAKVEVNADNITFTPVKDKSISITKEGKITGLTEGVVGADSTDVVVGKQLHATNEATLTFNGDSGSFVRKNSESKAFNIHSGDFAISQGTDPAVNYKGKNLATQIDNGTLKIGLREDPEFNKVTIENGPVLSSTGIDMNDKVISGLAKGKANTDAVTVKQLEDALAKLGGKTPATVDDNGEITAPSFELTHSDKLNKPADSGNNGAGGANSGTGGATGGTGTGTTASTPKATVGDALTALDNAIGKLSENLTGAEIKYKAGDETDAKAVALSTGLTFKPAATVENTDTTNLTISTADAGVVNFKLNDQLKGLASLEGKGTDTNKGKISFTADSKDISVNGGKLTNLADGSIGENSTDAVTGKQLDKLAKALGLTPNKNNGFDAPTFTAINGANGQAGTATTSIKGAIDGLINAVNGGLKFRGNNPADHKAQMLGSTLDIKAGDVETDYKATNLKTEYTLTNGNGVLNIGFKEAPTFTNITADSIGKDGKSGVTFNDGKVTVKGATNGSKATIDGLANGSADDEAVTAKQLKDALTALGGGAEIVTADADGKKKGDIKAPSYTLANADKLTNGAGAGGTTAATPKANVGAALTALDDAIGELSKGLTDQVIKYWSGDDENAKKSVKLSEGLNFRVADSNLTVSHGINGLITYGLSPTLSNLTSATFNGGANGTGTTTTINKEGVKVKNGTNETALSDNALTFKETPADTTAADPKKDISISRDGEKLKLSNGDKATGADTSVTLSNLKGGTIAKNGKDAATSGQLYDTAKSVADNLGGGATVGADGKVSQPSYHLTTATTGGTAPTTPNATGKVFNNVGEALTSLDSTISTLKSDSVSSFKVKSDDANAEITVDNGKHAANTNTVAIKGGKNITTKIENKAVVVDLDTSLTELEKVEAGTGDNKTTLTKDGVTTTKTENGVTKEAKQDADGFSVKAGDKTTKVTASGVENDKGLELKGGKDGADGAKATTLTVNNDGVTLNDKKVTGLVDGAIGDDSKDAVTGKQLKSVLDNIQASLGTGTVDPATGKVKDVKFNLKAGTDTDAGKDYNSVNAALGALDEALTTLGGKSIDEITIGADNNATAAGVTLNKKNKRIDVVGSEGITTAVDGNKITVKLDKTINNMKAVNFDAKDGTTVAVDQAGMTVTNTDAQGHSSHTIVNKDGLSLTGKDGEKVAVNKDNVKLENKEGKSSQLDAGKLTLANSTNQPDDKKLVLEAGANGGVIKGLENRTANADDYGTDANAGRVATEGAVKALADSGLKVNADERDTGTDAKTHKLGKEIAVVGATEEISHKTIKGTADNIVTKVGQDKDGKTTIQVGLASELKGLKEINLVKGAIGDKPEAKLVLNGDGLEFRTGTGTGDTAKTVKLEMGTQGGKLTGLESRNTDSDKYGVGENLGRVATESAVKKNRDDVESGVVGNIVYTDNDGHRLAKADDGNYYKSSDVTAGKANTGAKAVDNPVLSLTNANGRNTENVGEGVVLNNVKNGDISENSKQAVNGGQIYQVIQHIHNSTQRIDNLQNQVNTLSKDMRSGVAQAIAQANLPVNVLPGKSTLSVAAGSYMGKQAVAVGYSRVSDSGKVSVKFSLGHSGNKTSMGAGIGYSW